MGFLWHEVSEKEKQEIKKQASSMMSSFSAKLAKIPEIDKVGEPLIERSDGEREETSGKEGDKEFREIMFENAPNKDDDFIIAEKKAW